MGIARLLAGLHARYLAGVYTLPKAAVEAPLTSPQSFGFGRPPSINLAFVDCEIPTGEEITTISGTRWRTDCERLSLWRRGSIILTFLIVHAWTWQYTKLLHNIMTSAFAAKSPTYTKIMELDKRVRDFPEPPVQEVDPRSTDDNVVRTMQSLLATLYKESSTSFPFRVRTVQLTQHTQRISTFTGRISRRR